MDARLIQLYDQELQYLRERASEFAWYRPETARQLGLEAEAAGVGQDPHVERLLEGVALLAARVHHKLEADFPDLSQAILQTVYPHYVCPFPSCGIIEFRPDLKAASELILGKPVPRHTVVHAPVLNDSGGSLATECVYRTAHPVTLWPVELAEAAYTARDYVPWKLPDPRTRGVLRLRLKLPDPLTFAELKGFNELTFYIQGLGGSAFAPRLYERIVGGALPLGLVKTPESDPTPVDFSITPVGFADDEALLPVDPNTFQGYRLFREFFGFSARLMFFRIAGFGEALSSCRSSVVDLFVALDARDDSLEHQVHADVFSLYSTPAVNLFKMTTDPIPIERSRRDFEVIVDRNRRLDHEVYQVCSVTGHGLRSDQLREFLPFFYTPTRISEPSAFFTVRREHRSITHEELEEGSVPAYLGSDLSLGLVDTKAPPFSSDTRALTAEVLCTNRHLPMRIAPGSRLQPQTAMPWAEARFLSERCNPQSAPLEGELLWRIIGHLSLNFLSLIGGPADGTSRDACVFRDVLRVYSDLGRVARPGAGASDDRWIRSVRTLAARPVRRSVSQDGSSALARGLEVTIGLAEEGLSEAGLFLFGSVLERFLARFASINSFVETVLQSDQRGIVKRWPARIGQRCTL